MEKRLLSIDSNLLTKTLTLTINPTRHTNISLVPLYVVDDNVNLLYLQNQIFTCGEISYYSDCIFIGKDIDITEEEEGKIAIREGTRLTIDSDKKSIIYNGFRCEKGAQLIIK